MAQRHNQPKVSTILITILKKFRKMMGKRKEDRISALPDCLLLEILSRLPSTTEAIRTGTLSKRWKYIWTWVPTLIFDSNDNYYLRSNFFPFVDKVLTQCRQLKLKRFEVYTRYDFQSRSQVKNWICYAISHDVEELILGLWKIGSEVEVLLDQYFFINSSFTNLRLSCGIMNPTGEISWKNLSNLCLSHVKIDKDLIEKILSGSPLLETFVLVFCHGYMRLDITSKSIKNLVLCGYYWPPPDDIVIELNVPNNLSLTVQNILVVRKLLLLNVSSLVEANLGYTFMGLSGTAREEAEEEILKGLILNLSHVKELKIGSQCSEVMSRLEAKGFAFPSNLKFPAVIPNWRYVV